jgi:hypothetical protein
MRAVTLGGTLLVEVTTDSGISLSYRIPQKLVKPVYNPSLQLPSVLLLAP